jgi:hypothetical protein
MINCVAQFNGGDGMWIGRATNNTFIGIELEANQGYGLHLLAGSADQVFVGGDFNEGNRKGNVLIEPGNNLGHYFIGTDTGRTVVDKGSYRSFFLNRTFGLTGGQPVPQASADLAIGQAQILSGRGEPNGACRQGSLYLRTDGGRNSTLYVCEEGHWARK